MPINNYRMVEPVTDSIRSKEFIAKENFRNLYTKSYLAMEIIQNSILNQKIYLVLFILIMKQKLSMI